MISIISNDLKKMRDYLLKDSKGNNEGLKKVELPQEVAEGEKVQEKNVAIG